MVVLTWVKGTARGSQFKKRKKIWLSSLTFNAISHFRCRQLHNFRPIKMNCLLVLSFINARRHPSCTVCSVNYCPFSLVEKRAKFLPFSRAEDVVWEWYDKTTPSGQQIYVPDHHIKVKCVSHSHGAK
jgi:hypothetical protein